MSNSGGDSAEKEHVSKASDREPAKEAGAMISRGSPSSDEDVSELSNEAFAANLLKEEAERRGDTEKSKEKGKILTRRRFFKLAGGATAAGIASAVYAFEVEPNRLKVRHVEQEIPGLPAGCDGLKLAQMTDLHFQKGEDEAVMEKMIVELNKLAPDLIFYTGDYISDDMDSFTEMMSYLNKVEVGQGAFAISGNHDIWHGNRDTMRRQFEAAGVSYLCNAWSTLNIRGESLFIAGLDSVWGGAPDIRRSLSEIPKEQPALTLMHEPDFFDQIVEARGKFSQFSGHTHGGQCRVPLLGYAPVKVKYGKKYIDGHFQRAADQQLFVSSGIGTVELRARFACVPEIVLFTLRAKG